MAAMQVAEKVGKRSFRRKAEPDEDLCHTALPELWSGEGGAVYRGWARGCGL